MDMGQMPVPLPRGGADNNLFEKIFSCRPTERPVLNDKLLEKLFPEFVIDDLAKGMQVQRHIAYSPSQISVGCWI